MKKEKGPGKGPDPEAATSPTIVRRHSCRCDYCGGPDPTWRYPCGDFTRSVPGSNGAAAIRYQGGWRACPACHGLIDRDEWPRLLRRVRRIFSLAHPGLSAAAVVAAESELPGLWLQFQAHRTGPAQRIGGTT